MSEEKHITEDKALRTATSKTFLSHEKADRRLFVGQAKGNPMHVKKNGVWQDYDFSIESGRIAMANYDVSLLDGEIGYEGTDVNGKQVKIILEGKFSEPEINNNKVLYSEVQNGVDFLLIFEKRRIKAIRILKGPNSEKKARYISFREDGAAGKLINVGTDSSGMPIKMLTKETEKEGGITIIEQEFLDEVMVIDEKTRVRSWSKKVQYPVYVDPTSQFSPITSPANKQFRATYSEYNSNSPNSTVLRVTPNIDSLRLVNGTTLVTSISTTTFTTTTTSYSYIPNSTSPTSTVTNYNTGVISTNVNQRTWTDKCVLQGGILFAVSGIAQNSTINSAKVISDMWLANNIAGNISRTETTNPPMGIALVKSETDPSTVFTAGTTGSRSSLVDLVGDTIVGPLTNWSIGPAETINTQSISTPFWTVTPISTGLTTHDWTVTTPVQNRVNAADYTTEKNMAIAFRTDQIGQSQVSPQIPEFIIALDAANFTDGPVLEINYTTGGGDPYANRPSIIFS